MSNPIYIPTDAGDIFQLPSLSYRERIALVQKLLWSIAEHGATQRHLVSDIHRMVSTLTMTSLQALRLEKK
jgi:hypothetical protein